MKTFFTCKILLIPVLFLISELTLAQSYFRVIDDIPHLPVVTNTGDILSPRAGNLVFSTSDGLPMIYSGSAWYSYCEIGGNVVANDGYFTVENGIPVMSVINDNTSLTPLAGDTYYSPNEKCLMVYNGSQWCRINHYNIGSIAVNQGVLVNSGGALKFPVLDSEPVSTNLLPGAIYIDSATGRFKIYSGAIWIVSDCSCPPVAVNVLVDGDSSWYASGALNAQITYYDLNDDPMGANIYTWQVANDKDGNGLADLSESSAVLTADVNNLGKYIRVKVVPKSASDDAEGSPTESNWVLFDNCAPIAHSMVDGDTLSKADGVLYGQYNYQDKEMNPMDSVERQWYRNSTAALDGNEVEVGTGDSYTITVADMESGYIGYGVTPYASVGRIQGSVVVKWVNVANCPPQITLAIVDGDLGWYDAGKISAGFIWYDKESDGIGANSYQWFRSSNADGSSATAIAGATDSVYSLTQDDLDKYIGFTITPVATTGNQTGDLFTSSFQLITNCAPVAYSGVLGDSLNRNDGILHGVYTYQDKEMNPVDSVRSIWYRNSSPAIDGSEVQVGTDNSYTLTADDINSGYIGYGVIPVASEGRAEGSEVIRWVNVSNCAPQITMALVHGDLEWSQTGDVVAGYTWFDRENDEKGSHTYQWYRADDAAGNNSAAIAGATSATYSLIQDDLDKYLGFKITPVAATGNPIGDIFVSDYYLIENCAPVAHSGIEGDTLYQNDAVLYGLYSYQDKEKNPMDSVKSIWYRNSSPVIEGMDSVGTGTSYNLTADDVESGYIGYGVTPVASEGRSEGAEVIHWVSVDNCAPIAHPVVDGDIFANTDSTLYGQFSYVDKENNPMGNCILNWYNNTSASTTNMTQVGSGTSYTFTIGDMNKGFIGFGVTPVASKGRAYGDESVYWVDISNCAPEITIALIDGDPGWSKSGIVSAGYTWFDKDNDSLASSIYQWYRADDDLGTNAQPIAGATSANYQLTQADLDKYIGFTIALTAANGNPTMVESASSYVLISNCAPVAHSMVDGDSLNQIDGVLNGQYTYQDNEMNTMDSVELHWYRNSTPALDGNELQVGTGYNYNITSADMESGYIGYGVTPYASGGRTQGSEVVKWVNVANCTPQIISAVVDGDLGWYDTGKISAGFIWYDKESDDIGTNSYQWYRSSNADGSSATAIAGATDSVYSLTQDDLDKYIGFTITPVAETGNPTGDLFTSSFQLIENCAPVAYSRVIGDSLNQSDGVLHGVYTYQDKENNQIDSVISIWYRNSSPTIDGSEIQVGTGKNYTITVADMETGYIGFGVTPVATEGNYTGNEAIYWIDVSP